MTVVAKLSADVTKCPEDWQDFLMKGPSTEVMEKLRKKGYPILKHSEASSRQRSGGQWVEEGPKSEKG